MPSQKYYKETLIAIGYWYSEFQPELPKPQNFVRDIGTKDERAMVLDYLKKGKVLRRYLGFSECRFECGVPPNEMGSACLSDGKYIWPEGLTHYIEKHNVWLPDVFIEHIRNNPTKDNRGHEITEDNFGNYDWWKSAQALY